MTEVNAILATHVDRSLIVFWILSCFRKSTMSKKLRNTKQNQENGQLKLATNVKE